MCDTPFKELFAYNQVMKLGYEIFYELCYENILHDLLEALFCLSQLDICTTRAGKVEAVI